MANRTRTALLPRTRGTLVVNSVQSLDTLAYSQKEVCADTVGPGDCYDFTVNRESFRGGLINSDPGTTNPVFRNYHATAIFGQFPISIAFDGEKPNSVYAAMAQARTNPSRPYVDVPVMLLELGDITKLLQRVGTNLIREVGRTNLKYHFGVKPLVDDLIKLTDFHDQVARRVREIERLKRASGLRRTVDLDVLGKITNPRIIWQSSGAGFARSESLVYKKVVRGHCRWLPTVVPSKLPSKAMVDLARKAVLGNTIDFSTLWEITPWSWLIDWGMNVGDFLKAQRNIIPASLHKTLIVKHTTMICAFDSLRNGPHLMSGGEVFIERKERFPSTAAPAAHFPFLSGHQMGILASLAVARR